MPPGLEVTDSSKTSVRPTNRSRYSYAYTGSLELTLADQAGNATTGSHDALDRLTQATTANAGDSQTALYSHTLDGVGNVTQADQDGTITTFTCNSGSEIATGIGFDFLHEGAGC